MKQQFNLTCPICGHYHPAGWLSFLERDPMNVVPIPLCCLKCGQEVDVRKEETETDITYTLAISLERRYTAWLTWTVTSQPRIGCLKLTSVAVPGLPDTLFGDSPITEEVIEAQAILINAMLGYRNVFHEMNWMDIAIGDNAELTRTAALYTACGCLPKCFEPDMRAAVQMIEATTEISTMLYQHLCENTLCTPNDDDNSIQQWRHIPQTARVVDYLLRNHWFATQLEVNLNRLFGFEKYIRLVQQGDDGVLYFNNAFADGDMDWVVLYPAGWQPLAYSSLWSVIAAPLTPEGHLSLAAHSPDRTVTYAHSKSIPHPTSPKPTLH